MKRIVVVADDITGAAEVAGLAHAMGCRVRFTTDPTALAGEEEVTVLATDTRSMLPGEAVRAMVPIVEAVRALEQPVRLFKKCDSALRGYVRSEACELSRAGNGRILVLAANPSKGRCITEDCYTIDGVLITETTFRYDPEFPARTAVVTELVPGFSYCKVGEPLERFSIGESRSEADIAAWVEQLDEETLLVGAADAFRALLRKMGYVRPTTQEPFGGLEGRRTLIVCGSTVRHNLFDEPLFQRNKVADSPMPDAVFAGGSPAAWIEQGRMLMEHHDYLLLRIPQAVPDFLTIDDRREKAICLRDRMAETAAALIAHRPPEELVLEGGASAFALLSVLGWRHLSMVGEVAPGVVRLRCEENGIYLTFKPGSYPWGPMFQ